MLAKMKDSLCEVLEFRIDHEEQGLWDVVAVTQTGSFVVTQKKVSRLMGEILLNYFLEEVLTKGHIDLIALMSEGAYKDHYYVVESAKKPYVLTLPIAGVTRLRKFYERYVKGLREVLSLYRVEIKGEDVKEIRLEDVTGYKSFSRAEQFRKKLRENEDQRTLVSAIEQVAVEFDLRDLCDRDIMFS